VKKLVLIILLVSLTEAKSDKKVFQTLTYAPKIESYNVSDSCRLYYLNWRDRPVYEIAASNCGMSGEWNFLIRMSSGKLFDEKDLSCETRAKIVSVITNSKTTEDKIIKRRE